ncbi:hypothetical protein CTAYLR_000211 [Chrysophaeum taylorii]|uniref:Uncharacterized protein n=1 Tax=Chrysophaeum taylorii TaxID=2483200 RepID=A0AAD7UF28_9STRA|nr:hypothetical protein CTAYLR_000211 [Chrysophaeum taylorii]
MAEREKALNEALLEDSTVSPMAQQPPQPTSAVGTEKTGRELVANFTVMSLCFSLNHGTVTALIALASSSLGTALGNVSSGVLYLIYTLTAAFAAHAMTAKLGSKKTLVVGLGIYCFYVVSYLVAYAIPESRWYAVIVGAAFGGVAAGSIWPAQGVYFARTAELYAVRTDITREAATSQLGARFAATYLACEVTMKLLSSIVPSFVPNGIEALFALFTVIAFASVAGVATIDNIDLPESKVSVDFGKNALSATRLLSTDAICACMVPMNFAFGFGAAFVNGYFNSEVVKPGVGEDAIGYISAIIVGTAASLSLVYGRLGKFLGYQTPIVLWGAICFALFSLANLFFAASALGHWPFLVVLAAIFGSGRSVWEGSFKATFADYFPDDSAAAFANVQLQSGIASTIGFFLTATSVNVTVIGYVALVSAALALVFELCARVLYRARQRARETSYAHAVDHEDGASQDII